jgi:hypothetical protein
MKTILFAFIFVAIAFSCKESASNDVKTSYIYVSHTRTDTNDSIYNKLYGIDFSKYDMTLLGGDLAMNSFKNDTVINHLNRLFNLKSPTTLWSVGNHDQTSDNTFYKHTGKHKYHAYNKDHINFITLNSQDSLSSIIGKQKEFLFNVLDTTTTQAIVIMTHKLIFMNGHSYLENQIHKICNANKGSCYHCHNPNNFYDEIYPKLVELKKKGVQILWIGGDLGYKASAFEFEDTQGIVFLGNGLWYKNTNNKFLLLSKGEKATVNYDFIHIDSLKHAD